jgi:mannose/fructose/N-acetylgalactosamine-specific phosphotransferase system component IIB
LIVVGMVKEIEISELRRHLGIKKLKKKIVVTEADKVAIKKLREDEKKRISHTAARLKA